MMQATTPLLQDTAQQALAQMRAAGFGHAQVTASHADLDELNVNLNEPSMLRSTASRKLSLMGIVDGRMASTEMADLNPDAIRARVAALYADAISAPQDESNAVSAGQHARIVKGPQEADLDLLAAKMGELLEFRSRETPKMMIEEASAKHVLNRWHTLTTGGSDLAGSLGWYGMVVAGTAREGADCSSFNYAHGVADDLAAAPAAGHFGIAEMMRQTERQIRTQPLGAKFVGDVVLSPDAVGSLLAWLQGQLGDTQLIAGSSLYRTSVGQAIASPLLTLRSRFEAPGVAPVSADGFTTAPVTVVQGGVLQALTPSLYGSRKTGLPHRPVAPDGWEIDAGATSRDELIAGVAHGAIVGQFSMGMPAANGDFSGVIKNSFAIVGGKLGPALSEVMVTGNMARMLRDIVAVSRERIDGGSVALPWLRIANLHFS
jgi:PmbA protein